MFRPLSLVLLPLLALQAQQQRPLVIVPAASYSTASGVAPESIAIAFGEGLASGTAIAATPGSLPAQLRDTAVSVTDSRGVSRTAGLFAVAPGQVNFLIPSGTAVGAASVTVRNGASSLTGTVEVRSVAPGLFSADGSGRGLAAGVTLRILPDGTRAEALIAKPDPDRGVIAEPVALDNGEAYVSLFGSGLRGTAGAVAATANGERVPVLGVAAHAVFPGLDQVNIGPLPPSLRNRDQVEIGLTVDGSAANRLAVSILAAPLQSWGRRADLLEPNSEMSVAELNGRIYVIGGYPASRLSVSTVQVYDPGTDSWRLTTPLPVALNHTMSASANGKLYVIGGQPGAGGAGPFVNTTYEYDPATERWTSKARMPTERGGGAATVWNGKIYVAGGRPPRGNDFAVYDPAADLWSTLPNLPSQRNHLGAATVGGRIYVTGGRLGAGFESDQTDRVEVFDPVANTWATRAAMLHPRGGINVVEAYGCVHVFGGEGAGGEVDGVHEEHEVYDPVKDLWISLPPMPRPVHGVTGAVFANGLIYLPGGGTMEGGSSGSTIHQVYRPAMSCRP